MNTCEHCGLPRIVETAIALLGLVALSPLLLFVAVLVSVTSSGPVLFRQDRVGRRGEIFEILKFRTMRVDNSGPGVTKQGDLRVTSIGRLLRATKLDEFPELWNVVRGEMSLVGPRPELPQYVQLQDPIWCEVLSARPGITDPVTLRLRNEEKLLAESGADYETFYVQVLLPYKLRAYIDYLKQRSWKTDVGVLCNTVLGVLFPARVPAPSPQEILSSLQSR